MTVRVFPQQTERVETGAIQFGDDWPGLFIRGDDAFALASALNGILQIPEVRSWEAGVGIANPEEVADGRAAMKAFTFGQIKGLRDTIFSDVVQKRPGG